MDRQCSSCGGFCKKSGCERENITPPQPEPEPVAWISTSPARMIHWTSDKPVYDDDWKPLYTAPPQREPKPEPVVKLKEMLEVQGRDGTWNYDPYFHGMYNGMEVMLAVLENRELVLRGAPEKWLSKKEWVGLTDKEVVMLAYQSQENECTAIRLAEAKLKEKNHGNG